MINMVNLEWNEVKGYNRHFNYNGNVDNNVRNHNNLIIIQN